MDLTQAAALRYLAQLSAAVLGLDRLQSAKTEGLRRLSHLCALFQQRVVSEVDFGPSLRQIPGFAGSNI